MTEQTNALADSQRTETPPEVQQIVKEHAARKKAKVTKWVNMVREALMFIALIGIIAVTGMWLFEKYQQHKSATSPAGTPPPMIATLTPVAPARPIGPTPTEAEVANRDAFNAGVAAANTAFMSRSAATVAPPPPLPCDDGVDQRQPAYRPSTSQQQVGSLQQQQVTRQVVVAAPPTTEVRYVTPRYHRGLLDYAFMPVEKACDAVGLIIGKTDEVVFGNYPTTYVQTAPVQSSASIVSDNTYVQPIGGIAVPATTYVSSPGLVIGVGGGWVYEPHPEHARYGYPEVVRPVSPKSYDNYGDRGDHGGDGHGGDGHGGDHGGGNRGGGRPPAHH